MTAQPTKNCDDRRLEPMLLLLLACLQKEAEDCNLDLCYLGIQSGATPDLTAVWEDGSMIWVRLMGVAPIYGEGQAWSHCTMRLSADIEVGFATCYGVDEDGVAHTAEQDLAILDSVQTGMMALWRAVACCDWAGAHKKTVETTAWVPLGPEGNIVGGTWQVNVEF